MRKRRVRCGDCCAISSGVGQQFAGRLHHRLFDERDLVPTHQLPTPRGEGLFIFPLMLIYTATAYRVFRGKVSPAPSHYRISTNETTREHEGTRGA